VKPELKLEGPMADKPAPQTANMAVVGWQASASGGVGEHTYTFTLADGKGETVTQRGASPDWQWSPATEGTYRVKVVVADGLGNTVDSGWSEPYAVAPELKLEALISDKPAPQPAVISPIQWQAIAEGGVPPLTYTFISIWDGRELIEQQGSSPKWLWLPKRPGSYRVKVSIVDALGNRFEEIHSIAYAILPAYDKDSLLAVLPVDNLSGTSAPLRKIGRSLSASLARKGFRLLDNDTLEQFRKKHRMRHTGGVGSKISQAMQEETGVDGFFITSLEAYHQFNPPQISLISRLVSSGSQPEIIWIDSVGLSGDESPGLLALNRIDDPGLLLEKAVEQLTTAFTAYLDSGALPAVSDTAADSDINVPGFRVKVKYLPYDYFRSSIIDPDRSYSVAVIPMLNLAVRKNAGNIVSLHHIRELRQLTNYKVMEPGVVREELLRFRAVMPAGPSLALADLITSPGSLDVDLVLSGKVFDYQDSVINPKVDFSVQVFEKHSREVVFGARTFSTGDKGVFFFNVGRVFTAHNLLAEMSRTTMQLFSVPSRPQGLTGEIVNLAPAAN
jgi:hypothetical protein